MKVKYILLIVIVTIHSLLYCVTYIVTQDGSGDYISIQQAINQSVSGDIIQVYPGIYNENLLISKKSITLQSLYATVPDPEYIHNTIIRGVRNNSAIRVQARTSTTDDIIHTNVTIDGFTIMNDRNIYYIVSEGGGIHFSLSGGIIKNNIIKNCSANHFGGGIYLGGGMIAPQSFYTDVLLENNLIYNNKVHGGDGGGGLGVGYRNNLTFSQTTRNSIYDNIAGTGRDILFSWGASDTTIYLDIGSRIISQIDYFFVSYIQHTYDYEIVSAFLLDILQESLPRIEGNETYVSPDGDDNNSGLSWDSPLKSLDRAACLMAYPTDEHRTIYLGSGNYSSETGTNFPFSLPKNVNLVGDGIDMTNFDGGGSRNMISIKRPFASNEISNMTVSNFDGRGSSKVMDLSGGTFILKSIQFTNNGTRWAVGMSFVNDAILEDIIVNYSYGSSFFISNSDNLVMTNIIVDNLYDNWSWSINMNFTGVTNILVNNLTITNCVNTDCQVIIYTIGSSDIPPDDLGMHIFNNVFIANNICNGNYQLSDNRPHISMNDYGIIVLNNWTVANNTGGRDALRTGNRISGGFINNSIFYNPNTTSQNELLVMFPIIYVNNSLVSKVYLPALDRWFEHTTDCLIGDPIFVGMLDESLTPDMLEYYLLHETSPCIDSGMANVSHLDLPLMDLAGNQRIWNNRIDMGAFEFGSEPYVSIKDPVVPPVPEFYLTNYPNPFNPSTTISFTLAQPDIIKLNIYNIKGQLVRSLINDIKEAGRYSIVWDGVDEKNNNVSSGIYFYRLETSHKTETKKMLLMK